MNSCVTAACALSLSPVLAADHEAQPVAGDIVSVAGTVFARSDAQTGIKAGSRFLKPGDSIHPQDVVNTASDGHVKILMRDKSIVDLGPSSLFKVDHFDNKNGGTDRQVEVSLPYGSMRAAIAQKLTGQGKFKVRTPSATMGVRGTEFIVTSKIGDMKQLGYMLRHPGAPPLPNAVAGGRNPASAASVTSVTVLQGQVDMSHHDFDASAQTGRSPSALAQANNGVVAVTAGTQLSSSPGKPVQMDAGLLAAMSSSNHIADTTFQKAVTTDPGSSSLGTSGSSAVSTSLASALTVAIANVPPPPRVNAGDIGIPGAFSTTQAFTHPTVNTQLLSHTVHVVISP